MIDKEFIDETTKSGLSEQDKTLPGKARIAGLGAEDPRQIKRTLEGADKNRGSHDANRADVGREPSLELPLQDQALLDKIRGARALSPSEASRVRFLMWDVSRPRPESRWVSVEDRLPPEGTYVVVRHRLGTWRDPDDQEGVCCVTAKLVQGLSLKARESLPDGHPRKRQWASEDEGGNNERAYAWRPFGPGKFFGQDVTHWAPLPRREEAAIKSFPRNKNADSDWALDLGELHKLKERLHLQKGFAADEEDIEAITLELAKAGYVALGPDLEDRRRTATERPESET